MSDRKDVRRNRQRIVSAATKVLREQGLWAPPDEIARRAGVGRATVYRHLPDRASLLAAVLEDRIGSLEKFAARNAGPDLLEHLIVEICSYESAIPGLTRELRDADLDWSRLSGVIGRFVELLRNAHEVALAAGRLRADVTLDDVLLATAMLEGVMTPNAHLPPRDPHRALELLFRALRPVGSESAPLPETELLPSDGLPRSGSRHDGPIGSPTA